MRVRARSTWRGFPKTLRSLLRIVPSLCIVDVAADLPPHNTVFRLYEFVWFWIVINVEVPTDIRRPGRFYSIYRFLQ